MASLWMQQAGTSMTACFTVVTGAGTRQVKKATGTRDRKLAQRIADELEEAAQGRRKREDILAFVNTIQDMRARRKVTRTFDWALRVATGSGLESKTVRTYVDGWLSRTEHEVAPATWARYRQVAAAFLESLPPGRQDSEISSITSEDCLRYRDVESQRVAAKTANVNLKILRVIFSGAEADGIILRNPAKLVRTLKARESDVRRPFTLEEIRRVLEVADDEWRSLIYFGFYTGQRLADLAGLTWSQVDLQSSELRLTSGKTNRRIIIPLAPSLRARIETLPAGDNPKAPVHPRSAAILSRQNGRVSMLSRQFGDLLSNAGLAKARTHKAKDPSSNGRHGRRQASELSFHSLRHTFVSLLKATGAAEAVAMDLAGHESAEISRNYTSIDTQTKRAALEKLPAIR